MSINVILVVTTVLFLVLWIVTERQKNKLHRKVSELEYQLWRRDHPPVDDSDLRELLRSCTRATPEAKTVSIAKNAPDMLFAYTRSTKLAPKLHHVYNRRVFVAAHPNATPSMPPMLSHLMEIKRITRIPTHLNLLSFELHKATDMPDENSVIVDYAIFQSPIGFSEKPFDGDYPHFEGEYSE